MKVGLPLTLIVLMAYSVYYVPPGAAVPQITLGTTSMLTPIAYMLGWGGGSIRWRSFRTS